MNKKQKYRVKGSPECLECETASSERAKSCEKKTEESSEMVCHSSILDAYNDLFQTTVLKIFPISIEE